MVEGGNDIPFAHALGRARFSVACLLLFAAAFSVRVHGLSERSIWMDEDRQAAIAGSGGIFEIARRAAGQHQPPLDYFLEAIGLSMFGKTEVGARIHAVFSGALAVVLLFVLLSRYLPPLPVVSATLPFLVDPFHVRYSQEGRPIATGVLCSLLYAAVLFRFLEQRGWGRRELFARAGGLFIAGLILLLSVGFQPVVFLGVSCAALLPWLVRAQTRVATCAALAAAAASATVALPVLAMGVAKGGSYLHGAGISERISKLVAALAEVSPATWATMYEALLGYGMIPLIIFASTGLLGMGRAVRQGGSRRSVRFAVYVVSVSLLFPLVFEVLFHGLIRYRIQPRYLAVLQPALFAAVAVLVRHTLAQLSLKGRWAWVAQGWIGLIALSWTAVNAAQVSEQRGADERTDWRSLYALLKQEGRPGDAAYLINLRPFGSWTPPYHAAQFYYPDSGQRPVRLRHADDLARDYRRGSIRSMQNLFIVTPYGNEHINPRRFGRLANATLDTFSKLKVIHVKRTGDRLDVRAVFDHLSTVLHPVPDNYRAVEIHARIALSDGDVAAARASLERLRRLDGGQEFRERIVRPLRAAVRRAEQRVSRR